MSQLATVDVETGEIVGTSLDVDHDAKELATIDQGARYVSAFHQAVALAKAANKDRATVNRYAEQLVRHVRETGRLITDLPRKRGKRTDIQPGETDFTRFIGVSGLDKRTAMNWQSLYTYITEQTFDETIEAIKADDEDIIALSHFYGLVKKATRSLKEQKRQATRDENARVIETIPSIEAVTACFSTILIDPPWDWGDEGDADQLGRARPTYATMSIDELLAMKVGEKAAKDAHIYLWITNRSLPKGFYLLDTWGFRYVTCITWGKPHFGMGNYFRGQTEQCLFGVRGSLPLARKDVGTLFLAPRGPNGHSSKPPKFYDLIESCSPGPYLEIFSRTDRANWKHWGESSSVA
jgi:N6-adenosine-specific RNA methylase IME4